MLRRFENDRRCEAQHMAERRHISFAFSLLFPVDPIKMRPLPRQPGTPIPRFFQRTARSTAPLALQNRAGYRVARARAANCLEKTC